MQQKEAIEVIKKKAMSKYSGKPLQLLTMLVKGYSDKNPRYKGKDIDSTDVPPLVRTVVNLSLKLEGIGPDQMRNIIKAVDEIELVKWADSKVHLRLRNLDALKKLEDYTAAADARHKVRREYQTKKAREWRANLKKKHEQKNIDAVLSEMLKISAQTFFGGQNSPAMAASGLNVQ
ncbi:MAG: hypothetical protein WBE45_21340 [Terriglobales bacterium]